MIDNGTDIFLESLDTRDLEQCPCLIKVVKSLDTRTVKLAPQYKQHFLKLFFFMPKGSYCKSGCKKHASFEFAAIKRGAEEDFSLNHFFFACAQSHGIVALPGAHKAAICIRLWQSPKRKSKFFKNMQN